MDKTQKPSVGVLCSAREEIPEIFKQLAFDLGVLLANNKITTVFGGGNSGAMSSLAKGSLSQNGDVIGVTTDYYISLDGIHENLTQIHICSTLEERKKLIYKLSDVLCIFPGGFGTLDELLTFVRLNKELHLQKTIVMLDIHEYYSLFLNWLENIFILNTIDSPSQMFCIARSLKDLEKIIIK